MELQAQKSVWSCILKLQHIFQQSQCCIMPACSFLNPTGTETFIKLKNPDSNHTDTHTHTHTDLKRHGKDGGPHTSLTTVAKHLYYMLSKAVLMATLSGCVHQPNRHFEFHFSTTSNHRRSKTTLYTHTYTKTEQSPQGWKSWTCSHVSKDARHTLF